MTPSARIKCALTLSGVNPNWDPMMLVLSRSAEVISALHTVNNLLSLKTAARCVSGRGNVMS